MQTSAAVALNQSIDDPQGNSPLPQKLNEASIQSIVQQMSITNSDVP